MKCTSCGANLQIDNAFCPYCGTENKEAKKHREDMKRYESDYKATKEEVIDNSQRFNRKTLRIAAVAITVAAIAFMIPLLLTMDRFRYSHERNAGAKRAVEVESTLIELIANDDYLGVNELIEKEHLYFDYNSPMSQYSTVRGISATYADLIRYAYEIKSSGNVDKARTARVIGDSVNQVFSYAKRLGYDELDEVVKQFIRHAMDDTGLYLVTFLGVSAEDAEKLSEMTDAQRSLLVEEAFGNVSE